MELFWLIFLQSSLIIVLLCLFLKKSRAKLEEEIQKVRTIQVQLKEVGNMEETDVQCRKEAFAFCKSVEKTIMRRYLDFVNQPQNFLVAKLFGYPTKLDETMARVEEYMGKDNQ